MFASVSLRSESGRGNQDTKRDVFPSRFISYFLQVQLAAFKQTCPFSILPTYFACASRNKNNIACCRDTKILADTGPQCAEFCDPVNGNFQKVGFRHLICATYLEEIMHCHWAGIT